MDYAGKKRCWQPEARNAPHIVAGWSASGKTTNRGLRGNSSAPAAGIILKKAKANGTTAVPKERPWNSVASR